MPGLAPYRSGENAPSVASSRSVIAIALLFAIGLIFEKIHQALRPFNHRDIGQVFQRRHRMQGDTLKFENSRDDCMPPIKVDIFTCSLDAPNLIFKASGSANLC